MAFLFKNKKPGGLPVATRNLNSSDGSKAPSTSSLLGAAPESPSTASGPSSQIQRVASPTPDSKRSQPDAMQLQVRAHLLTSRGTEGLRNSRLITLCTANGTATVTVCDAITTRPLIVSLVPGTAQLRLSTGESFPTIWRGLKCASIQRRRHLPDWRLGKWHECEG